jgi:hypothetical protein
MDPYDAGYAFGQSAAAICCLLVAFGAIGAAIWWGVTRARRSRPPAP